MPACGNWWWKWGGDHMTSVQWWQISMCEWSCRHNWTPFLRWCHGECWEAPTGHCIPSNCTKHCCWIWEVLWPCCSLGTSSPSLLPKSADLCCWMTKVQTGHTPLSDWMRPLSYAPLCSEGHVSTMTHGTPSGEACGHLHQLQVCNLLQHKDLVVCLEGLTGKMEASWFTFQELPLWDATAPGIPSHKPQLIEVNLGGMQSASVTTAIQTLQSTPISPPPADTAEPSSNIATAINLLLTGTLLWLQ